MPEQKLHELTNVSTLSGAVISGMGALTINQWLAVGGFMLALAGFLVNVWHKRQMVKLRRREVDLEAARLQHEIEGATT